MRILKTEDRGDEVSMMCRPYVGSIRGKKEKIKVQSNNALVILWLTFYFIHNIFVIVQWIRNSKGKEIALVNGYSFTLDDRCISTNYWQCKRAGCHARFTMTKDKQQLKRANLEHNHPAPHYMIVHGVYIKI